MTHNLAGKTAIVTGGGGAICGAIAKAYAAQGVAVAVWDLSLEAAAAVQAEIGASGGEALAVACDVTQRSKVENAFQDTLEKYGTVDILVNGAGGSRKETTTSPTLPFFDLSSESMRSVFSLNYLSAVFPCQVVGRIFAEKKSGVILNISSIAGIRPLTRAVTYSDAKAAVSSFTRWLAVHMAQEYSARIRVNAIAPGFILTQQNRFLLFDEDTGSATERGKQVLNHVPASRYGEPEEVAGAAVWLASDMARFVTGVVIPVDGGFSAFGGV